MQHRHHDEHHHQAHADDQQGFQQGGQCHGAALHLARQLAPGAAQHLGQLAGLLAQAREHGQQARKAFLGGQRRAQRRTFAHLHQGFQRIGAQLGVGQGLGGRLQGLEDGHAGTGQHAQGGGEARRVVAARQAPEQRHGEPEAVEAQPEGGAAQRQHEGGDAGHAGGQQQPAPVAHEIAQGQHEDRQPRQLLAGAGEGLRHLRHHIGDEKDHDHQRHQRHHRRVGHGADQLGTQQLALLQVVGQALQHQAERAAGFAGRHHAAVNLVELARRGGQRAGEGGATVDLGLELGQQLLLTRLFALLGQGGQRALQRQAAADQAGELARPHRERGRAEHARLQQGQATRLGLLLRHHLDGQRRELHLAQLRARGTRVVGLQQPGLRATGGVQRFVLVGGHLNRAWRAAPLRAR